MLHGCVSKWCIGVCSSGAWGWVRVVHGGMLECCIRGHACVVYGGVSEWCMGVCLSAALGFPECRVDFGKWLHHEC